MNLVSNAAEAMPNGGRIVIKTRCRYFDTPPPGYDNFKEGDYVVLSVSDNGIGMAPDEIERIFEPFYTKKEMGRSGTGLGMAVVWGTVKDHNGSIDVDSTPGQGTTFKIIFPATHKQFEADQTRMEGDNCRGSGEKILVVDDVREQREVASKILEALGYMVSTVSSGEEAIEFLKTNSVDLFILDMIMRPGDMDGLETYRKILNIHPGQKAIITSGYSETHRVKKALALGAGQYIRKPYTLQKISLAVKKELTKRGKAA
jgi:CheY-like chemotaxis protein